MKKIFLNLVIIACLAVFAVCAYQLAQYFYGNIESEKQFDKQRDMVADISEFDKRLPKYQEMKKQNSDFEGWIIADGTNVNYPVVQTVNDTEYYLYRDFQGNYSKPGTIFLSNVADLYKPSDVVTVFGHNMKDGTMFGSVRRYEDKQFLEEHDSIWIDSLEGRRKFKVTHVMKIRVDVVGQDDVFPYYNYSNFIDKSDFKQFIKQCNAHSIYDTGRTVKYGDKFVILSTCEYSYDDGSGRLVVMGKEIKPRSKDGGKSEEAADVTMPEITKPMMGTYVMIGIGVAGLLIIIMLITWIVRSFTRKSGSTKQQKRQ